MFLAVHGAMVRPWMQWIRLEVRGAGAAGGKDCQSMPVSAVTCRVCEKSPRLTTSPPHQLQRLPSKQSPGNPHQIPSKKSRSLPSRSLGLETEVWRNAASGHDFCGRIGPSSRQRVMLCACGSVFCIPSECLRTS
jgi:hypothetical protein